MELEYRFADIDELDFLVRMRIRDLRMFLNVRQEQNWRMPYEGFMKLK